MYKLIWSKDVKIILEVETENFPLPSVTICPQWFSASNGSEKEYYGNAKTLIELNEQLPSVEKFLLRAEIADQSYRYVPSPIVPLSHCPTFLLLSLITTYIRPIKRLRESWTVTDFLIGVISHRIVKCSSFDFNVTSVSSAWDNNVSKNYSKCTIISQYMTLQLKLVINMTLFEMVSVELHPRGKTLSSSKASPYMSETFSLT